MPDTTADDVRRFRLGLVGISGIALAIRWATTWFHYRKLSPQPPDLTDNTWYWIQSNLLARGKGYANPFYFLRAASPRSFQPNPPHIDIDLLTRTYVDTAGAIQHSAGHPPGYTTYLAVFHLLGLHSPTAMRLASGFLGVAAAVGVALLARRVSGSDRAGLLAGLFAAIYPNLWINDGLILSESLAAPLIVYLLWCAYRLIETPTWMRAAWMGLAVGLCCLTRSESQMYFVLFLPPLALWSCRHVALRQRVAVLAISTAVAIVVIAPWVGKNLTTFEHPVFLAIGAGFVLDVANCDSTYHGNLLGYTDATCSTSTWPPDADESEIELILRRHATAYIDAHKGRLVTVVVPARVGRIWNVYRPLQGVDFDVFFERRGLWPSRLALLGYYVFGAFAAVGAVEMWRRRRPLLPMGVILLTVTITAASTMGITRYRLPAELVWVTLGGIGADHLWRKWSNRSDTGEIRDGNGAATAHLGGDDATDLDGGGMLVAGTAGDGVPGTPGRRS